MWKKEAPTAKTSSSLSTRNNDYLILIPKINLSFMWHNEYIWVIAYTLFIPEISKIQGGAKQLYSVHMENTIINKY